MYGNKGTKTVVILSTILTVVGALIIWGGIEK